MWTVWFFPLASAQDAPWFELEAGERFRPTDEVLAALGAPDPADKPEELEWGAELDARLSTELACGALKFDVDVNAMLDSVNELPGELAGMGVGLASSLPMLALCHLSPSICAELKNLNLRIDQDIDFRAAMCRSIDAYIDEQADEGARIRRDAETLAQQQCIRDAGGDAIAVRECTEHPQSGLVTDIAKGFLGEELSRAPQRVIASALDATNASLANAPGLERFLTGIAGEAEIGVNGEVFPVLEPGSLTSEDIREALLYWGEHYTCSQTRLSSLVNGASEPTGEEIGDPFPSSEYAVETLVSLLRRRLTEQDVTNLGSLPWATYRSFCFGLRNTAAREAAVVMRDQVVALTRKAEENPELPSLGVSKLRQARQTTEAVLTSLTEDAQVMDFAAWSEALAQAAKSERGHQRALSETLREGEHGQRLLWVNRPPCNSLLECQEAP